MRIESLTSSYLDTFRGLSWQVWAGLGAVFTNSLGTIATLFLSLFLVMQLHFSVTDSGFLITAFGVGAILGSSFSAYLCNKYSAHAVSITALIINSMSLFLISFLKDFSLLMIVITIMGAANSSFIPANRFWLMRQCDEGRKTRVNSLRFMIVNFGMGIAIFIGGLLAKYSYTLLFSFNGLAVLLSAMILLFFGQAEDKTILTANEVSKGFFSKLTFLENRGFFFIYLMLLMVSLMFAQLRITYPLYLKSEYHLSAPLFSDLFLINTVFIIIFQISIVDAVNKFNQFLVAGVGSFLVGMGMFFLMLGSSYVLAIVSCFLWTIGEMLAFPVIQMLLYNRAKESNKATHIGLYQSVYSFANVAGPVLGSWAYKFHKGMGVWMMCGVLGLMCLFIGVKYRKAPRLFCEK
jgi:predicted MFS family arabinose efflux permease